MTNTAQNELYDTAQAAAYIGYSKSSLDNWRMAKVGPAFYQFGKRVRYKKSDLDAYIERGRVETRTPRAS